jgi:hypothetical protein
MTQLLQPTLPFSGRSNSTRERSRRAAEKVAHRATGRRLQVLSRIVSQGAGGATDNEVIRHFILDLGVPPSAASNGVRNRRGECEDEGWVVPSGAERDGCTVWVATDAGRAKVAVP